MLEGLCRSGRGVLAELRRLSLDPMKGSEVIRGLFLSRRVRDFARKPEMAQHGELRLKKNGGFQACGG